MPTRLTAPDQPNANLVRDTSSFKVRITRAGATRITRAGDTRIARASAILARLLTAPFHSYTLTAPDLIAGTEVHLVLAPDIRITRAGDTRITRAGDTRVTRNSEAVRPRRLTAPKEV